MRPWSRVVLCLALATAFLSTQASAQIRTVLVSPVPGNPSASGSALLAAVAGIASPSSTNTWLVKIEPGIYDVGATPLQMRSWIDIEGSGIGVTTIRGTVDPLLTGFFTRGTVNGASNAELRLLTVEANGTSSIPGVIAMVNPQASPRIYRVRFATHGVNAGWGIRNPEGAPLIEECEIEVSLTQAGTAYGIVYANQVSGTPSVIRRTKIAVTGTQTSYGIYLTDGQTVREIWDSKITVSGGVSVYGLYSIWSGGVQDRLQLRNVDLSTGSATNLAAGIYFDSNQVFYLDVVDSRIYGTTYGIRSLSSSTVEVRNSELVGFTNTATTAGSMSITMSGLRGGPATAGGWLGCAGVWDESGTFYPGPVCP